MIAFISLLYFIAAGLAIAGLGWLIFKVVMFFVILANPDNLPGFNLFKAWFSKK